MLSFLLVLTTLLSTGCLAASSFSRPEAPAGSVGWHDAVRPHHLRALERDQQSQQRQEIGWANCPNVSWAEAAQEAGLLSVKLFGAVGNGTADDAPAVRRAMNASELCGGCVFFPPTSAAYKFDTTVALRGCIKGGGGGGGAQGQVSPSVPISGPDEGPVVSISGQGVFVQDITFNGGTIAVYIANAAVVRFVNVGAQISRMGTGIDSVNSTVEGCNRTACNVVLGSMNAAMVIENSFWLWFEHCSFVAQANSGECVHPYKPPCGWGQRPAVILRGQDKATLPTGSADYGVVQVYLVRMDRIIFSGGGVQYQQMVADPGGAPAGWFDFVSCTQEVAATPLLDLQSAKFKGYFPGLVQVIIRDYLAADALKPHYGAGTPTVVAVNCSAQGCEVDGLSVSSAGLDTPTAVRVYDGHVSGTTIETAARGIYSGHGVVDRHGLPTGTWRQTNGAGWEMSGAASDAALQFLVSGETKPSKVINVDGSVSWRHVAVSNKRGDHSAAEPVAAALSVLNGHITNTTAWDPPPLSGSGGVATVRMGLLGVQPGDAVTVGLSSVNAMDDDVTVQLTATAGEDVAKVVLQNVGASVVDLPEGALRLVVAKMV